jgi:hypothetical protein
MFVPPTSTARQVLFILVMTPPGPDLSRLYLTGTEPDFITKA